MFLSHFSMQFFSFPCQIASVSVHKVTGRRTISGAGSLQQPKVVRGMARADVGLLALVSRSLAIIFHPLWPLPPILKVSKEFKWSYGTSRFVPIVLPVLSNTCALLCCIMPKLNNPASASKFSCLILSTTPSHLPPVIFPPLPLPALLPLFNSL